jgi:hypothetical protein
MKLVEIHAKHRMEKNIPDSQHLPGLPMFCSIQLPFLVASSPINETKVAKKMKLN